ncbi:MAG: metallophosphoesterase, partial [Sedimentisphaerales bacterium]|nr:metallophosphoesterase [Sedimentisphaerales bacterium]
MILIKKIICPLLMLTTLLSAAISTNRNGAALLPVPAEQDSFIFAILGDRTSGKPSGLDVLKRTVADMNVLAPDLVVTMGDYIQGYGSKEQWLIEAREYKAIVDKLTMPWYPLAGNHEVYWRGNARPAGEHESSYEEFFGPLWYSFRYKNACFIMLFSDEGDALDGKKGYNDPACQAFSPEQLAFLAKTLKTAADAEHVFVFIHHPRWLGESNYYNYGDHWQQVHEMLAAAGNVSACFASHHHQLRLDGVKDGISYYGLSVVGASIPDDKIDHDRGYLNHATLVSVQGDRFSLAALPTGSLLDPQLDHVDIDLLAHISWVIKREEDRTMNYVINIPKFSSAGQAMLRIGILDGADDSGDRGVNWQLCSTAGQVLTQGFLNSEGTQWLEYPVSAGEKYEFRLIDNDTSFEGKYPGNSGGISIKLDIKLK